MELISRKAAKVAGLKYYFTGYACHRGHIDVRFVSSFSCMTCAREKAKEHWDGRDEEQRRRRSEYEQKRWQKEEIRQRHREYARSEKERVQKLRRGREWSKNNREKLARKSREWYRANSEYAIRRQKAYVATRPIELRRALGRKSRAKRRAVELEVFVEAVDPRAVFDRDNGICGICGEPVEMNSHWEIDHIIPITKGGPHSYANVQLAHRRCNRSKGAKVAS